MVALPQSTTELVTLLTAVICFGVGLRVIWINPRRFPNQTFSVFSLLTIVWLLCVYAVMKAGRVHEQNGSSSFSSLSFWIRVVSATGSLLPLSLLAMLASITG